MKTFQELNLSSNLNRALQAIQFQVPTPIQAKAIPLAVTGKDIIACAQTGTGKTAAFCIPLAMKLLAGNQSLGLVLAPTRELAQQIEEFWRNLTRFQSDLKSVCLIGGASFGAQVRGLRSKPRLIIATPGRLVDHINRKTIQLNSVQALVLDEADRMLDMGFAAQLNRILQCLPKKRQTLLFSATWDSSLDHLVSTYMFQPERITVGAISQAAPTINQSVVTTTVPQKNEKLLDELNQRQGSVLVFARTQTRTDRLARYLHSYGLEVGRLHGGRTQGQRNSALAAFRHGRVRILVATDIAARGIDVAEIAHVINYDLPQVPEDYIHRIGRTGRAGNKGQAVSLLTPEDRMQWRNISRLLKKSGTDISTLKADFAGLKTAEADLEEVNSESPSAEAQPNGRHRNERHQRRDHQRRDHRNDRRQNGKGRPFWKKKNNSGMTQQAAKN